MDVRQRYGEGNINGSVYSLSFEVTDLVHDVIQGDKKLLLEKALQRNSKSSVFWAEWLQYRIDNESFETDLEKKDFLVELNTAFGKVIFTFNIRNILSSGATRRIFFTMGDCFRICCSVHSRSR